MNSRLWIVGFFCGGVSLAQHSHPPDVTSSSPNKKSGCFEFTIENKKEIEFDPENGKIAEPVILKDLVISPDSQRKITIYKAKTKDKKSFDFPTDIEAFLFSPDKKHLLVETKDNGLFWISLERLQSKEIYKPRPGLEDKVFEKHGGMIGFFNALADDPKPLLADPHVRSYMNGNNIEDAEKSFFSPDGKFFLTNDSKGRLVKHDTQTGHSQVLDYGIELGTTYFLEGSSDFVAFSYTDQQLLWIDGKTFKKKKQIPVPSLNTDVITHINYVQGNKVTLSGFKTIQTLDLQSGSSVASPDLNGITNAVEAAPDTQWILTETFPRITKLEDYSGTIFNLWSPSKSKTIRLPDLRHAQVKRMDGGRKILFTEFPESQSPKSYTLDLNAVDPKLNPVESFYLKTIAPDNFAVVGTDSQYQVVNHETGEVTSIPKSEVGLTGNLYFKVSQDKKYLVVNDYTYLRSKVFGLPKGDPQGSFTRLIEDVYFDASTQQRRYVSIVVGDENRFQDSDSAAGAATQSSPGAHIFRESARGFDRLKVDSINGGFMIRRNNAKTYKYISKRQQCAPLPSLPAQFVNGAKNFSQQKGLLCEAPFQQPLWDKVYPAAPSQILSWDEVEFYLAKFQKPGAFDVARDAGTLLALLRHPEVEKNYAKDFEGVFINLATKNPELFDELQSHLDWSKLSIPKASPVPTCRNSSEKNEAQTELLKYAQDYIQNGLWNTSELNRFKALGSGLKSFSREEREYLQDELATKIAEKEFPNSEIFTSKLYSFAMQGSADLFDLPKKDLTDLTLIKKNGTYKTYALSSSKFKDANAGQREVFGFHIKELPELPIPPPGKTQSHQIPWKTESQGDFSAHVTVEGLDPKAGIAAATDQAPYEAMWKDNVLRGFIVMGSNLGDAALEVSDEFLAYYENEGFEFQNAQNIPHFQNYLAQQLTNGKVDYFSKEAHSDGDEKNLFRIPKAAKIVIGKRTREDGKKEEVILAYPSETSKGDTLLSNQDFGDLIRQREQTGDGPLVMINGSCWSHTKAVHELEAAQSPLLIEIPSKTSTYLFSTEFENATGVLVSGLRSSQTWDEINAEFQKIPHTHSGKDVYLLPNQKEYDTLIREKLKTPSRSRVKITDAKGKDYSLEAALEEINPN